MARTWTDVMWFQSKLDAHSKRARINSEKLTSVVEHLTGSKITLKFSSDFKFYTQYNYSDKSFRITVYRGGKGYFKSEIIQRSVSHELSHILFKSHEGFSLLKLIFRNKPLSSFELAKRIYNAFEDYRVDELYFSIYPGERKYNKMWNTALIKRGYFSPRSDDPLTTLLKFSYDFKPENDYEQRIFSLLEKVKGKTAFHSVLLTVYFFINYYTESVCSLEQLSSMSVEEISELIPHKIVVYPNIEMDLVNEKDIDISPDESMSNLLSREEKELNNILTSLLNEHIDLSDIYIVQKPDIPNNEIHIDYNLVDKFVRSVTKTIENIFSNKPSKYINYQYGSNLDVDSLIQSEFNPSVSDIFLIDKKIPKLRIIFLLDCSGSMEDIYNYAIHAFLALKRAFRNLSKLVEIEAYGFSAQSDGSRMKTIIYDLNDEKSIRCVKFFGRTPISDTLRWISYNKENDEKTILVLVTDGYSNISCRSYATDIEYRSEYYLEEVRDTILEIKSKNIHTTAFLICSSKRVAKYYPNRYLIEKEELKDRPHSVLLQPLISFCINHIAKEVIGR